MLFVNVHLDIEAILCPRLPASSRAAVHPEAATPRPSARLPPKEPAANVLLCLWESPNPILGAVVPMDSVPTEMPTVRQIQFVPEDVALIPVIMLVDQMPTARSSIANLFAVVLYASSPFRSLQRMDVPVVLPSV